MSCANSGQAARDGTAATGLDLHLELSGPKLRAGLEDALREAVQTGRLAAGTRLPASRTLAADLGVARNTVADAYGQLVAEGWLTARQGSGTHVAEHPEAPAPEEPSDRHMHSGMYMQPDMYMRSHMYMQPDMYRQPDMRMQPDMYRQPDMYMASDMYMQRGMYMQGDMYMQRDMRMPRFDLRPGRPDLSDFPRAEWLAAARRAITAMPSAALGYGDPRGQPELRAALAAYLARARGVRASPGQIVICSGFTQALALLGRVLAGQDRASALAVEAYGHQHHRDVIAAQGLAVPPVAVDEHGAVIADLARHPEARALLLTPAHQFPLGVALAPQRRNEAVQWAARTGAVVIEDDYDGEFRYDRRAVGAMQALAPEHVIYAGTASKTLAPAVRLAWIVVPGRLLDDVVSAKALTDRHGSSLDEMTLAELVASGAYDRHVRRARLRYRRRRDWLVRALARVLPGARLTGVAAGMHAVLQLPPGAREDDVIAAAAGRGLALDGMRNFRPPAVAHPEALVLGYGTPPAHAFTTAVTRLCAILAA
jgi:GntR family transcriptional regulator/MocR family aminotransferase